MTIPTMRHALAAAVFAVALVVSPAIYAIAQPEGSAPAPAGRMSSGCDGMMAGNTRGGGRIDGGIMGGGMMGRDVGGMMGRDQANNSMMGEGMMGEGMMGEGMMGGGMMGGQPPNQQWRR